MEITCLAYSDFFFFHILSLYRWTGSVYREGCTEGLPGGNRGRGRGGGRIRWHLSLFFFFFFTGTFYYNYITHLIFSLCLSSSTQQSSFAFLIFSFQVLFITVSQFCLLCTFTFLHPSFFRLFSIRFFSHCSKLLWESCTFRQAKSAPSCSTLVFLIKVYERLSHVVLVKSF